MNIQLTPDIETAIEQRARAEGISPEQVVLTILRNSLSAEPRSEKARRADGLTDDEFEHLIDRLVHVRPQLSDLPDQAISRPGIYDAHP